MKKILLSFFIFLCCVLTAAANDLQKIDYKNIKEDSKIQCVNSQWTTNVSKKEANYLLKKVSSGTGSYSEFYNQNDELAFSTNTQYEFIKDGRLYGYSNYDLKFYELNYDENILTQRELSFDEVKALFPEYRIIKISEFSALTNSIKIKKDKLKMKVIVLNDTDRYLYKYSFSTGNSKIELYPLNGFVNIKKRGMIQFSHFGDNTKDNPWFVILVR